MPLQSPNPAYSLLCLCARLECDSAQSRQIVEAAGRIEAREALPAAAEAQGMAPLLYHQLKLNAVQLPQAVRREFQALTLRHRVENEVRLRLLTEILTCYADAGIPTRVLKGAALCCLLYPDPALRPMSDLDLLVSPADADRAQALLAQLGFYIPPAAANHTSLRHLEPASRTVDGVNVAVEIHHDFFEQHSTHTPLTLLDLSRPPLTFSLPTNTFNATTLGYEEMLWHLCQHSIDTVRNYRHFRLIWAADIISFSERFASSIDWDLVRSQYPQVLKTLAFLGLSTPLAAPIQALLPRPVEPLPREIGRNFKGWPLVAAGSLRPINTPQYLYETFFPGDWWLLFFYGLDWAYPRWQRRPRHLFTTIKLAYQRSIHARFPHQNQ